MLTTGGASTLNGPVLYQYNSNTGSNTPIASLARPVSTAVKPVASAAARGASPLDSISAQTKSAYQTQLDQASNLYDSQSASLSDQLGSLDRQKQSILDQIGGTYSGLVQSAKDTLAKNVGLLHGREGEVGQQYDTQRQNTARLLGDTERKNRIFARGSGLLGSSFYLNDLQGAAGREATSRISGLNSEEQGKLDAIGSAITNANIDTNTKIDQLGKEEANAKNDIIGKFIDQANAVHNALNFNQRDKITALNDINNRMRSALDSISQTFAGYQQYAQSLPQVAQQFTSTLNTNPFSDIQPTLDNLTAYNGATADFGTLPAVQQAGPGVSSLYGYLNRTGRKDQSYLDSFA